MTAPGSRFPMDLAWAWSAFKKEEPEALPPALIIQL
jgi:hypothetical protein